MERSVVLHIPLEQVTAKLQHSMMQIDMKLSLISMMKTKEMVQQQHQQQFKRT